MRGSPPPGSPLSHQAMGVPAVSRSLHTLSNGHKPPSKAWGQRVSPPRGTDDASSPGSSPSQHAQRKAWSRAPQSPETPDALGAAALVVFALESRGR